MFGAISKFFKKSETVLISTTSTEGAPKAPRSAQVTPKPPPRNETVKEVVSYQPHTSQDLSIPYSSIIKFIPSELWGQLAPAGVAGYNFSISRQAVVSQLPHGAVKVPFGEVRQGAPAGVFINTPVEDSRPVNLPLDEILARLHPDAFARRSDQCPCPIQNDVPDVFGDSTHRGPLRVMERRETGTNVIAQRETNSHQASQISVPHQIPQSSTPPNASATSPIKLSGLPKGLSTPAVLSPAPAIPTSEVIQSPLKIAKHSALPSTPNFPSTAFGYTGQQAGRQTPSIVPVGPLAQGSFTIALDTIAENWPDAIRQELAQLKIPDGKIALPPVEVCEGLKRGRIQYPWRTLRSWIQPLPIATSCGNEDQILELPLETVTPAFLDFIRSNPVNRNTAAADNITEFFRKAEQTSASASDSPMPGIGHTYACSPAVKNTTAGLNRSKNSLPTQGDDAKFHSPTPKSCADETLAYDSTLDQETVCVALSMMSDNWPETVLRDISQFNLANTQVKLPLQLIEAGLRCGRVEFQWHQICTWLNPSSKAAQLSINGEVHVQIPLTVITPLFLKFRAPQTLGRKRQILDSIPDLFNSGAKTSLLSSAEPANEVGLCNSKAGNAGLLAPINQCDRSAKRFPTSLSELFGEHTKTSWTPNEIVQRSTSLPGVAGALIALQDGLLVASSLPTEMKTEMIAAFVPQIFGRLNQYSRELQLGNATGVGLTVEAGSLQVYNAGIIYFAALSRPGEILPVNQLQLIATELSRHTK